MPHPGADRDTAAAGVCQRFGGKPPDYDPATMARFKRFVRDYLEKNLTPLSPDTDTSFETWLSNTNYPEWRKQELRKAKVENVMSDSKNFRCKSFVKDEVYPEYKHARGINSRTDPFKCAIGPWFKVIEKEVFKDAWFIKKVPVADRPMYIRKVLDTFATCYLASDYTSFEALFTAEIMDACEFQLYKYMTQFLPGKEEFWEMLDEVLGADNICMYKHFKVTIKATRMSGEMCTSLGNGFSNKMFIMFICSELGSEVRGVVEGDDGLFSIKGIVPKETDFEKLGLRVKLEYHTELSEASFCGMIFDERDCINITDPLPELATFGLGSARYSDARDSKLKSLLRCKALSLVHQYPGCPIIQEMGLYGIRMTRGQDVRTYLYSRGVSMWEREQLIDAISAEKRLGEKVREPPMATRLLVEKKYGITVEVQRKIEAMFREKNDLLPFRIPQCINPPVSWEHYFNNYAVNYQVGTKFHFTRPMNPIQAGEWRGVMREARKPG